MVHGGVEHDEVQVGGGGEDPFCGIDWGLC